MKDSDREFEKDLKNLEAYEQYKDAFAPAVGRSACAETVELGKFGKPNAIDHLLRQDARGLKARYYEAHTALNHKID